uniref:Uncharacterized protein n=1 Tax=Timema cristinae TaxID=61476 RepID=A0A7R9CM10_TIMCR|nr:unnamed protein product [Timema cristinae]
MIPMHQPRFHQLKFDAQCPNNVEPFPEDTPSDLDLKQEPQAPAAVDLTNEDTFGMSPLGREHSLDVRISTPPASRPRREIKPAKKLIKVLLSLAGFLIITRTLVVEVNRAVILLEADSSLMGCLISWECVVLG